MRRVHGQPGARLDEIQRLYEARYAAYARVARAIVGDPEVARDVVQDAFATAVQQRTTWRAEGPLEAWLWRIVVNRARESLRSEPRSMVSTNSGAEPPGDGYGDRAAVRAALSALPERQRLALFLRYYADLDYEGIARTLGIESGTVGASLHAARERLRSQLQEVEP